MHKMSHATVNMASIIPVLRASSDDNLENSSPNLNAGVTPESLQCVRGHSLLADTYNDQM